MIDLAEKILEAIGAKEVLALATSGLKWRTHDTHVEQGGHCAVVMRDDDSSKPLVAWLPTFTFPGWDVPGPWADARFMADNDPASTLRRCAADREIIQHYRNLLDTYRGLTSLGDVLNRPSRDLPALEARIADFAAVILPALARGYGVTDE